MFSVSDLNEEQVKQIRLWVEEGAQMADVQKRLESEFGHIVTYMDTRFLSLDLGLEFQVEEEPEPEPSCRSSLATSLAFSSLSPSIVSCAVISFCRDASTIFHAFSTSRFRDATT